MSYHERAFAFECCSESLYGIATVPEQPSHRGVLIVVGGPQYRAGSHRQFTLLARALAAQGIPAMRFDYRGMGDSEGALRTFEEVQDDLRAAIDQFTKLVPDVVEIVIWGLCDAASAALFYAHHDPRVTGLVLLNPWVRTEDGFAKTTIKHYYRDRLFSADLWKKILTGRFNYAATVSSFARLIRAANGRQSKAIAPGSEPLPERMLGSWRGFQGKILLILSEADLTAKEFLDTVANSTHWQRQLAEKRVTQYRLADADHTFSRRVWRDQVSSWTSDWVKSW